MTKPMTEEQRARWARWRSMGRTRFMLMGILLYGVPWFLLMLIWEYFLGGTLWHHSTLTVSFLIILGVPVGVSIGGLHWRNQERRFAEATAASSFLPPATPPSPAPPAATPPHRRNWWSRNWVWFVPAGCLTMLVCLALVVCAFVLVVVSAVKSSDFYRTGVARAKSDARVQAALGSDLHDGMFLPGDTHMNGFSREYELRIPISGSKGKGTIYLVVAKSARQWQIDNLSVKTNDGEIIDLNETNPSSISNAARDQSNPATAQADSRAKPLFNFLNPSRALGTSPHIRGDPDAPVTLEVFEDFACKPCA
jgi:hypothetical protein